MGLGIEALEGLVGAEVVGPFAILDVVEHEVVAEGGGAGV